ncbi:MAG: invasion associated locus B family protein [Pseudomonadota bacterium]
MTCFRMLLLVAALAAPMAASAQSDDGSTATPEAASALPDETLGETYIRDTYGDWALRCIRSDDGAREPCQLYQLLTDDNDNPVSEITLFQLPPGGPAEAGATIVTPLETLLTQPLRLTIDGGDTKQYPYTYCQPQGCVARIGLLPAEVEAYKRGAVVRMQIVPAAAPDRPVDLSISLTGFTAAYEALLEG